VTLARARFLVVVGAVGLLTLGSLAAVSVLRGGVGLGASLQLANCGPKIPKGALVNVTMADGGGMMMGGGNLMMVSLGASPESVPAGTVTFVATNVGALSHELLILPAPVDGIGTRAIGSNGKIDESTSIGEASTSCGRGPGPGISPGTASWVTLRLTPGNYELLCDEPWHYANGMFTGFTVR
jgi:uncharacterized cupredoxin-like copper-binding protein